MSSLPKRRRILEKLELSEVSAVDRPCQEGAMVTITKRAPEEEARISALDTRMQALKTRVSRLQKAFNPNQPRDKEGQWSDGGGGGAGNVVDSSKFSNEHLVRVHNTDSRAKWKAHVERYGGKVSRDPQFPSMELATHPTKGGLGDYEDGNGHINPGKIPAFDGKIYKVRKSNEATPAGGLTGDYIGNRRRYPMPDDIKKVAELEGMVTDLETQVSDLEKKLAEASGDDYADLAKELMAKNAELVKQIKELGEVRKAEADAALAKAAEAEAITKLSAKAREHYDSLSEEDKKKFLEMKDKEKEDEMEKRRAGDETVTIEGQTIRKSAVGDATFEILKAQSARIKKGEDDLALEKKAREDAVLSKRADDEFGHVPGTVEERAAMLGAIEKMEPALKKSFLAVFTQSEKLAKAGFGTLGHGDGTNKTPELSKAVRDFTTKVDEIAARDKIGKSAAMTKARAEHPDLFKVYQSEQQQTTTS